MSFNVLLLGTGGVGQRHMRNIKSILGDVCFYVRDSSSLNYTINNDLTIDKSCPLSNDFDIKILSSQSLDSYDYAVIASPTSFHFDQIKNCIVKNIPVYIEKPCVSNAEHYKSLLALNAHFNTFTCVGFQMRFNLSVLKLKSILQNQSLEPLHYIYAHVGEDVTAWHKYEDFRDSSSTNKALGGGVVLTQIHEFDLVEWLTGGEIVNSVGSVSSVNPLKIDVESSATSLLEISCREGIVPCTIHQNYLQSPKQRYINVVGVNGHATCDIASNKVTTNVNGLVETFDFSVAKGMISLLNLCPNFYLRT